MVFYKQYLLARKPINTVYKIPQRPKNNVYEILLFREKCSATWKSAVVFIESKQILFEFDTVDDVVTNIMSVGIYQRSIYLCNSAMKTWSLWGLVLGKT